MRIFSIQKDQIQESAILPLALPLQGFLWMAFARREFEILQQQVQAFLLAHCGAQIYDLHLQDLLNNQLPSHYDFTADYDLLVFRRLARGRTETDVSKPGEILHQENTRGGPSILRKIDTSPVAFLVLDRVVISVHPADCSVRDVFAARMLSATHSSFVQAAHRLPANSADLMLRMVSSVVDGYLDLRRELTRQLDHWQSELINPKTSFNDWSALLNARLTLHYLDEVCEDQRAAITDWIDALDAWKVDDVLLPEYLEMLKVRSRDVLEHIERVVHHVGRLEQSAETAVQMHFNAQSNRTNDIMRTLTVLTAIFLPLNLITGFFGMNFENFPALHSDHGLFLTEVFMGFVAIGLALIFWRKRYVGG
ncbi:magnesium transporter CorA family protein [Limnohabitans sp. T6-20]|uniref:magnesium transporter CorA family protein n=1 Tax=Limnohabitans sp. T6-20 TaxID=1100725 RepID=UPI000D3DAC16|nr:magnesium transporter CorA family protein [Limnohabitans sp. T6-20]PUE08355.1 magnesium transporter CorA [Limnohabitans sp. T6-20]